MSDYQKFNVMEFYNFALEHAALQPKVVAKCFGHPYSFENMNEFGDGFRGAHVVAGKPLLYQNAEGFLAVLCPGDVIEVALYSDFVREEFTINYDNPAGGAAGFDSQDSFEAALDEFKPDHSEHEGNDLESSESEIESDPPRGGMASLAELAQLKFGSKSE